LGQKKGDNTVISIIPVSSNAQQLHETALKLPVSIFCDRSLSVFEIIVEYLKDSFALSYHDIAVLTNRDDRTIWTVYHRVTEKRSSKPKTELKTSSVYVPLSVLLDRRYAVLESIVLFLKERLGLSYHEIAKMLGRNDRTIWTVYNRLQKKQKQDETKK
jgi:DNA-binding NarL/FixJ family response regulator